MKVGSVQMDIVKRDKAANFAKVRAMLQSEKIELAVLPELFATGYFFNERKEVEGVAENVPNGETTKALCELAKETGGYIIGSVVEKEEDRLYICAVVTGPQGYLGKQRKRHLTELDKVWYCAGEESNVFEILGSKVGILVCFDAWFPESARELKIRGAQIICQTALISSPDTMEIMRVRALENKAFVVVANAIGEEEYQAGVMRFRGESRIIDFLGNISAAAGTEECLVIAEIEADKADGKAMGDCADLLREISLHRGLYQAE